LWMARPELVGAKLLEQSDEYRELLDEPRA
jgi:hypothetical protein